MKLFRTFLRKPPFVRAACTAAIATVMAAYGIAGFFLWFDGQMATFKAIDGLQIVAQLLEARGHLPEAEAVLREIVRMKSRQTVGPLFPGGLLPHEYFLDSRADLARVISKEGRALACRDEYARLLADAVRLLGAAHPYTLRLREDFGSCAWLPG
jgi:hypothetical protein